MAKKKMDAKELMDSVVDLDLLKKRKEVAEKKKTKNNKNVEEVILEVNENKWYDLPMLREDFTIIEKDNKYYGHYSKWKDCVYIGPYDTEKDLQTVIDMYVKETKKKDKLKRKFNVNLIKTIIL